MYTSLEQKFSITGSRTITRRIHQVGPILFIEQSAELEHRAGNGDPCGLHDGPKAVDEVGDVHALLRRLVGHRVADGVERGDDLGHDALVTTDFDDAGQRVPVRRQLYMCAYA
jgi:hypothetical protein